MGPVSGYFIDLASGTNVMKNYYPAFLLLFIYGVIDIIIISSSLKVRLDMSINTS